MDNRVNCRECTNLIQKGGLRTYGRCKAKDGQLIKITGLVECADFVKKQKEKQEFYDKGYDMPDIGDNIEADCE
ncbi:hypothetical protein DRJ17_02355 [Candidatus Woesearchaeota archaeon]|nr:MAG: hypothetical protein DRJ17_02355 [Candidatus Woesearchaeota archaeon]